MSRFALAMALILLSAQLPAAAGDALDRSILDALDDPGVPFRLEVYCLNGQSRRSLAVFRGAVAVWNGEQQVRLGIQDRRVLLGLLLDSGFADFEARYGEQSKADKQEAPLRVSCRISLTISGNEKTSVQLLEGVQSNDLLGLAGALLDRIEPLAAQGISATSLEDALAKLADGVLAPEVLELRLLRLVENREEGSILRIRGGDISQQSYTPGKKVGDVESGPIDACSIKLVSASLEDAAVWDLPRNLRYSGTTELDITVLGFRQNVQARSTFRSADADTQARFERLIERLENRVSECPDSHS